MGIIFEQNKNINQRPIEYKVVDECWINISHSIDKDGYGIIKRNGKKQPLHRYILTLYKGKPENKKMVAMHLCNNKRCINPSHLIWGSVQKNTKDAYIDGLSPRGSEKWNSILNEKQVEEIKKRIMNTDDTFKKISAEYNVTEPEISAINRRKIWSHIMEESFIPRKIKKVTKEEIDMVISLLKKGYKNKQIEEITGLKKHVVADIKRRKMP